MARLSFGVCFAPDPPPSRWVELTKLAEAQGFEYAWLFDSHVLWQEVYPIFTLMAANTRTIKIGPCVTNPGTRDPTVTASALATLNAISGGRMVMGIGRGDSARRVLGQKPVTVEEMEADCRLIRDLAAGREVSYDGVKVRLKWAEHELPIWVAGYGPKALRAAGRVADGVIIQLADPAIIKWCLQFVREGAEEAGRSFDDIQIQAAAPAFISDDLEAAREQVRWFPALVSNHVVDLLKRYDAQDLPKALTDYIKARDHYDYSEHAQRGAAHADFVPDDVIDRFCVIGTVEQSRKRIEVLIENDGTVLGKYRKTHIPHVGPCFWEKFYFKPGNLGYPVWDTSVGRVGILICYDRHFPEPARALGLKGAELVFNPSATVKSLSRYLWELEQPAHAVANGYWIGAINRVGIEKPLNDAQFYGSSYFCDPRGRIIGKASETEDEVLVCELDLDMNREVRNTWQFLRDRRPESYEELVRELP